MTAPTAAAHPAAEQTAAARLDASHAWCHEHTRARAANFYHGMRLAPEPKRSAMFALYAWMRHADDLADGDADDAMSGEARSASAAPDDAPAAIDRAALLDQFRADSHAALEGGAGAAVPTHTFWPAFTHTARRYRFQRSWLDGAIDGVRSDLDHEQPAAMRELERYCWQVASTVGLACVAIWRLRTNACEAEAQRLAERQGVAFQLTNILRDLREDHAAGRCYVPRDALAQHGLTPACLGNWRDPRACEAVVRDIAAHARAAYDESAGLAALISPDCLPVQRGLRGVYAEVLRLIEADPARVSRERVRVSRVRKLKIVASAALWPKKLAARA